MGQAKQRGSFDERKAQAVAKREQEDRQYKEAHPEAEEQIIETSSDRLQRSTIATGLILAALIGRGNRSF